MSEDKLFLWIIGLFLTLFLALALAGLMLGFSSGGTGGGIDIDLPKSKSHSKPYKGGGYKTSPRLRK